MNHGTPGYWRGCRCDTCRAAYSEYRHRYDRSTGRTKGTRPGLPDDGIIDPVAVERLLAGTLPWQQATYPERLEAGRIALRREGGHAFCADILGLRHDAIRRLRQEVAA